MADRDLELVVRWPDAAGPVGRLLDLDRYPLARTPRQVDPHGAEVWVACGARLVARFRSSGWTDATRVRLLDGTTVTTAGAGRLHIEPGTARTLRRPIPMVDIDGGSTNPFRHPHAVRYLQSRPRRFVVATGATGAATAAAAGAATGAERATTEVDLPVTTKEAWVQVAREQAPHLAEGVKHATEAALVLAYDRHRTSSGGRPLVRHRLHVDGTCWSATRSTRARTC